MTSLAEAVVLLAHRGYRVFPTGPDKAPRTPRGFHDGTTDPAVLRAWGELGLWKDGGIGLVIPDRTFVVDVDPRNGGDATMAALVNAHGSLPSTRRVGTQSGGEHWYYALPDDRELRGTLGPGVDVKKPGRGYVLVPPTPGYTYLRGGKPAPAPHWLLDELTVAPRAAAGEAQAPKYFAFMAGTGYGLAALRARCEQIRNQGEGGRRALLNTAAFSLAGLVAGGELDEDKTLEELLAAAIDSGLSEKDALSRIKSGWDAGLRKPVSADD